MPRNDLDRLFDIFDSLTVGFGPVFKDIKYETNSYPPHNIVELSDSELQLELAVAGFKKSEITMQEHQGLLTVKGTKEKSLNDEVVFQHRGIASRSFTKTFRIAEFYEVADAYMEDGILAIRFIKNIPEEAKPKLIAIN